MARGEFRLSCDAVLIVKGELANGQQRLMAVSQSGIACQFLVMRTDDEGLYKIIDAGAKRSVADVLGGEYRTAISAITSLVLEYDKNIITASGHRVSRGNSKFVVTRTEKLDFARDNEAVLLEIIRYIEPMRSKLNLVTMSVAGTLAFIGFRKDRQKTLEFIKCVFDASGVPNSATDFRERLIRNRMSKAKLAPSYTLAIGIKALRSFINGSRPGVLKLHDGEAFPKL
jgi:hypothetical protein